MARSRLKLLLSCSVVLLVIVLAFSPRVAQATPGWISDSRLSVYIGLNGRPITTASSDNPIQLNMTGPMHMALRLNNTDTLALNVSANIIFYYQGIAILTIHVRDPSTNQTFVLVPAHVNITAPAADFNLGQLLMSGGIQLVTGLFQASVDFFYNEMGNSTVYHLPGSFYVFVPSSVFTSVAGIATTVVTAGAVWGIGNNFYSLIDGLKAASKFRTIQKKASEIRSLPNLTVLGALPLLFSIVKQMKTKKKGKDESKDGVSGYIIKQRLREVAPDAWQQDVCPKCKTKWDRGLDKCNKCGTETDDAKRTYAELLTSKVDSVLRLLSKKKALSIRKIAKSTKSNNYNSGVIGAALVDTSVVEVTKIETPIRSFAMNLAGLGFLLVTWDQLLGFGSSQWQITLSIVTAALSVGVIFALYFARKSQIGKLRQTLEAGKPLMPTEEERVSAAEEEKGGAQAEEPEEEKSASEAEEPEEEEDKSS